MSLPPGPESHPVFTVVRWIRRPFEFMEECNRRYGEAFTIRFPGFRAAMVVISNPDAIREIFHAGPDAMHAGEANVFLGPFLGKNSLLLLDGKEHIRHRKLLLPAFHGERMQAYGRQMLEISEATVDAFPVGRAFPIHPRMRAITLEIILRTVFGLAEGARFERLSRLLAEALDIAAWPFILLPFMQLDLGRFSHFGRFMKIAQQVDELLLAEIRQRRDSVDATKTDVLSMLLSARDEEGRPMTDEELRDELITLLVAGHETTATALAWSFRWLLERRDVRTRLVAELESAREGASASPEALNKLPYLDAVVKETLRLQPVIPLVGRVLKEPTRVMGYDLPVGTVVAPSIYLSHMRPNVFPNPHAFVPERFLDFKPAAHEWFPFGGGTRRCIGMAFALYEMKMVLASTLARVSLRLAPDAHTRVVRRSITLTPPDGLPVIVSGKDPRRTAPTPQLDAQSEN